jgi:hypothetical protein
MSIEPLRDLSAGDRCELFMIVPRRGQSSVSPINMVIGGAFRHIAADPYRSIPLRPDRRIVSASPELRARAIRER